MYFKAIVVSFIAMGGLVFAGDEHGGGDINDISSVAWFRGKKEVRYCIETDAQFGISANEVDRAFLEALDIWKKYINTKTLNDVEPLVLNFKKMESCQPTSDLRLYLGIENEKVKAEKKKYTAPLAFSAREHFDYEKSWSQGFIWVAKGLSFLNQIHKAPDWAKPDYLTVIFLHEIGHLLGCEHVPGTIMSSRLAWQVIMAAHELSHPVRKIGPLKKIDFGRELFVGTTGDGLDTQREFEGGIRLRHLFENDPPLQKWERETFKRLFGRHLIGDSLKATIKLTPQEGYLTMDLIYQDKGSEERLSAKTSSNLKKDSSRGGLVFAGHGGPAGVYGQVSSSESYFFDATTKVGEKVRLLLEYNDSNNARVDIIGQESMETIFQANLLFDHYFHE